MHAPLGFDIDPAWKWLCTTPRFPTGEVSRRLSCEPVYPFAQADESQTIEPLGDRDGKPRPGKSQPAPADRDCASTVLSTGSAHGLPTVTVIMRSPIPCRAALSQASSIRAAHNLERIIIVHDGILFAVVFA